VSQETTNRYFDDLARALAEGSLSRRGALKLFAGSAIAALIPSRALAGGDDECVRVCHVPFDRVTGECDFANAVTRCVSRRERRRHLQNHPCDCRGRCAKCLTPECLPGGVECTVNAQCCSDLCQGGTCAAFGTNNLACRCNDISGGGNITHRVCLSEDCNTLEANAQTICTPLCATDGGFSGSTFCQPDSPECVV
jgi:hypothetical protein